MSNFKYMTDIVEFGFADSFRKGLSGIAKKGKSIINDVRGTNPGSKTINIKPTSSTRVQPKKATAYGAPGDYNLTNKTNVTPGGAGSYKTKKKWYDP